MNDENTNWNLHLFNTNFDWFEIKNILDKRRLQNSEYTGTYMSLILHCVYIKVCGRPRPTVTWYDPNGLPVEEGHPEANMSHTMQGNVTLQVSSLPIPS